MLQNGTPESVGMDSKPLVEMVRNLTAFTVAANYTSYTYENIHPIEPGGTVLIGHNGPVVSPFAFGKRNLYADANGTMLAAGLQENATLDTIYDLASLKKLFTTVAALRQMDIGNLALNTTVATYIPEFAVNGKVNITILMLLTHTSGFAPDPSPSLYSGVYSKYEAKIQAILDQGLENAPGSTYLYSDLNFMTLMIVLGRVTGQRLDELIWEYTSMMGMNSTFFNRNNLEWPLNQLYWRTATEEFQIEVEGKGELG